MLVRFRILRVAVFRAVARVLPSSERGIFIVSDISPDSDNFSATSGSLDSAACIKRLIIDPDHDTIVPVAGNLRTLRASLPVV
ncbi:MAG: hypothetical protein WA399_03200 [Acidobacteriaceae bacterium]